jgi:hypothetical protein
VGVRPRIAGRTHWGGGGLLGRFANRPYGAGAPRQKKKKKISQKKKLYICKKIAGMAYTEAQYKKLKDAIAAGVHSVSYGDKAVTYRSIAEMKEALLVMENDLYPEKQRRRLGLIHFCRGFNGRRQ